MVLIISKGVEIIINSVMLVLGPHHQVIGLSKFSLARVPMKMFGIIGIYLTKMLLKMFLPSFPHDIGITEQLFIHAIRGTFRILSTALIGFR